METIKLFEGPFSNYLRTARYSIKSSKTSRYNEKALEAFLNYFMDLNEKNEISHEQFRTILKFVTTNYIENEIEFEISTSIQNKIEQLIEAV